MVNNITSKKRTEKDLEKHIVVLAKRWKNGCICTSILSSILLIIVLALMAQPPKIEYKYGSCPTSNTSGGSSTSNGSGLFGDSSSASSSSPGSSSGASTYQRSQVITYSAGEKAGTNKKGVTIEIEQITKNYQNYSSYFAPESGYEYVQVKLKLKNNTGNAISLYYSDFYIKDGDGMMDDAQTSHHDNDTSYFPFGKQVASGSEVSGVMIFEVKKDSTDSLTFLYEKDTSSKQIIIEL